MEPLPRLSAPQRKKRGRIQSLPSQMSTQVAWQVTEGVGLVNDFRE